MALTKFSKFVTICIPFSSSTISTCLEFVSIDECNVDLMFGFELICSVSYSSNYFEKEQVSESQSPWSVSMFDWTGFGSEHSIQKVLGSVWELKL